MTYMYILYTVFFISSIHTLQINSGSNDTVSVEGFEILASDDQPELRQSPEVFQVQFNTDADKPIVVEVNRTLAPIGADRFYDLVMAGFYDTGAFFRVVPGFVLQFGISGDPDQNEAWLHNEIQDDPVVGTNVAGTITYAATLYPNSRTTQVFINYADNSFLDAQGFAPFGRVVLGLDVAMSVHNPTPGQSGGVDQQMYEENGNDWLRDQYPGINFIQTATVRQAK